MKFKPVKAHEREQIARYKEQLKYEEINGHSKKLYKILLWLFFIFKE
jgi:hypothetical protein